MTAPPAARPTYHFRLDPAQNATVLSKPFYELRARDGRLICQVSRDRAAAGLRVGALELWSGPHGTYLRSPLARYPQNERAQSNRESLPKPPKGAVTEKVQTRKHTTCGVVGGHRRYHIG